MIQFVQVKTISFPDIAPMPGWPFWGIAFDATDTCKNKTKCVNFAWRSPKAGINYIRLAGWGMYFMAASHVLLASGFESEKSEGGIREENIRIQHRMWPKEDTNGALHGNRKLTQYLPILL